MRTPAALLLATIVMMTTVGYASPPKAKAKKTPIAARWVTGAEIGQKAEIAKTTGAGKDIESSWIYSLHENAGDTVGMDGLVRDGKVLMLPRRTKVLVVGSYEDTFRSVRIQSGDYKDALLVVMNDHLSRLVIEPAPKKPKKSPHNHR